MRRRYTRPTLTLLTQSDGENRFGRYPDSQSTEKSLYVALSAREHPLGRLGAVSRWWRALAQAMHKKAIAQAMHKREKPPTLHLVESVTPERDNETSPIWKEPA